MTTNRMHKLVPYILMIKPIRCTNFSKFIFEVKLYMFQTVPLSIIRDFFTVHTAMVYVSCILIPLASCQQICMTYYCCVYSEKTPDDGQRDCPKHVEFYSKNKLEKLVHLVGFIIRIYHDAQSPEHQFITMLSHLNINLS